MATELNMVIAAFSSNLVFGISYWEIVSVLYHSRRIETRQNATWSKRLAILDKPLFDWVVKKTLGVYL
jgi:hypothetical protein